MFAPHTEAEKGFSVTWEGGERAIIKRMFFASAEKSNHYTRALREEDKVSATSNEPWEAKTTQKTDSEG